MPTSSCRPSLDATLVLWVPLLSSFLEVMSRGTRRDGELLCHKVIQAKSVFFTASSYWRQLVLPINAVENITWARMCKGSDQKAKTSLLFFWPQLLALLRG